MLYLAKSLKRVAMALCCYIVLAGCGGSHDNGGGSPELSPTVAATGRYQTLLFTLSSPTALVRGQDVPCTFSVKNTGNQPIQAGVSAVGNDASVSDGNSVVWQLTKTEIIAGGSIATSLAPGETRTYNFNWNQTDSQNAPLPSGQYTIKAWWLASVVDGIVIDNPERQLSTSAIQVTIR